MIGKRGFYNYWCEDQFWFSGKSVREGYAHCLSTSYPLPDWAKSLRNWGVGTSPTRAFPLLQDL